VFIDSKNGPLDTKLYRPSYVQ